MNWAEHIELIYRMSGNPEIQFDFRHGRSKFRITYHPVDRFYKLDAMATRLTQYSSASDLNKELNSYPGLKLVRAS